MVLFYCRPHSSLWYPYSPSIFYFKFLHDIREINPDWFWRVHCCNRKKLVYLNMCIEHMLCLWKKEKKSEEYFPWVKRDSFFLFIAIKVYGELSLDKLNQEIMKNHHFKVNMSLHLYVHLKGNIRGTISIK